MKKEEIEDYYNDICYGVEVIELWKIRNRQYFSILELSPMGKPSIYNIYSENGRIFSEDGDDIIQFNDKMLNL